MDLLLDNLAKCLVKSKMDLLSGFWQVILSERAKTLTSFILPDGRVFRFLVLPMGLSVSPGIFQGYTTRHVRQFKQRPVVKELLAKGSVVEVLVDDFLFGSPTVEDHKKLLNEWLKYAAEVGLTFKESKCEFF